MGSLITEQLSEGIFNLDGIYMMPLVVNTKFESWIWIFSSSRLGMVVTIQIVSTQVQVFFNIHWKFTLAILISFNKFSYLSNN